MELPLLFRQSGPSTLLYHQQLKVQYPCGSEHSHFVLSKILLSALHTSLCSLSGDMREVRSLPSPHLLQRAEGLPIRRTWSDPLLLPLRARRLLAEGRWEVRGL